MDIIHPEINQYLNALLPERHAKLLEMERYADERNFPIIGPQVGRVLYQYVRMTGARRVFEMGSGFGYSAFWIAMALPEDGKLTCSEASQNNVDLAEDYLKVAGLLPKVQLKIGDALKILKQAEGPFDLIFCDVDKEFYPEALALALPKLRVGGTLITDNALFHGRVLNPIPDATTRGVVEYTRAAFSAENLWTTILPVRDGLAVSWKMSE
ncbi:MAG: O-methyltransferase [bacterium]